MQCLQFTQYTAFTLLVNILFRFKKHSPECYINIANIEVFTPYD